MMELEFSLICNSISIIETINLSSSISVSLTGTNRENLFPWKGNPSRTRVGAIIRSIELNLTFPMIDLTESADMLMEISILSINDCFS